MKILINDTRLLNDGNRIPVMGLGVFKVENDVARDIVKSALQAGIRLVDTAQAYNNEQGVGDGIILSGIKREELFITTKIWNSEHGYEKTLKSFEASLKRLKLTYVDLVLVHWPMPLKDKYVETYRALEKIKKDGLARSIGVSNFNVSHLEKLLASCEIVPALNQIELHPYLGNAHLADECMKRGIAVQAWSPLGKAIVLQDETVAGIAHKHEKTPAQVVLRWHYQKGHLTIPKSVHIERVTENTQIFDFTLSPQEITAIDALDRGFRTGPDPDNFERE